MSGKQGVMKKIVSDNKAFAIFWCITAITFVLTIIYMYRFNGFGYSIRGDGMGYYSYLPAVFDYHDITFSFNHEEMEKVGAIYLYENNQVLNKFPVGPAILIFPFYAVADIFCKVTKVYPCDGYSQPYQISVIVAAFFYFMWGLIFLYDILKKKFDTKVVLWTLVLICFGTNLFHYAVFDGCYSHVYSFGIITLFVWLTDNIENDLKLRWWKYLLLGIVAGLIFDLRNINIVCVLYYVIYNATNGRQFLDRLKKIFYWRRITFCILGGLFMTSFQMAYWFIITGKLLVRSYSSAETFHWLMPHILSVLASTSKGLIVYSPVLIFSIYGAFMLKKYYKFNASILIAVILHLYISSAWYYWSYGHCFGQRVFVDLFVFYSIFLACALQNYYSMKLIDGDEKGTLFHVLLPVFVLMMFWTMKLMLAYWYEVLPHDGATGADILSSLDWNFTHVREALSFLVK